MQEHVDRQRIVALVMAGGEGTRFWPRSRRSRPKQFLSFAGEESLLSTAVQRLEGLVPRDQVLVMTGKDHVAEARRHVSLPDGRVVGEPVLRDTAPCIAYGARLAGSIREDAVLVVVCADHLVGPRERFQETLLRAADLAAAGDHLVTIGLRPDRPATGYGYIETGDQVDGKRPVARGVVGFREKPDLETARRFVLAGRFLWNSGMFAFTVNNLQESVRTHLPEVHDAVSGIGDPWDPGAVSDAYSRLPRISFDFGVLEKATNVVVVEADFDWDDVGTFEAVARHAAAHDKGNAARGEACFMDARGNLVDNALRGLVVLAGVDDLLVVRTEDALLVMPREDAQRVKSVVRRLDEEGYGAYL